MKEGDPTANWETYINNEQGYSIEHPPEWSLLKDSYFSQSFISAIKSPSKDSKNPSLLSIEVYSGELSYDRYAYFRYLNPKETPKNLGQVIINGISWEKYSDDEDLSANNNLYVLGATHKGKKYFLVKNVDLQTKDANKDSKLIEQILSTFKFIPASPTGGDQNQVVCTQDVKLCPDGSYVSRQPPNCEFAACPQK